MLWQGGNAVGAAIAAAVSAVDVAIVMTALAIAGHGLLYRFSRDYRLWSEIKAHRAQVATGWIGVIVAVERIVSNYDLSVSHSQVIDMMVNGK